VQRPVSLGSFGAGLTRLLALTLALCGRRGASVLVDEIDAGLHYSTMRGMWETLIAIALRLDLQVFVTTHSSDCWQSLGRLCAADSELAKQVRVHRLERGLDRSIEFTADELAVAAGRDIEIR
jgi:predicted ATP-dependent endonuclease of OLD family